MEPDITTVSMYRTKDGKVHDSFPAAYSHNKVLKRQSKLQALLDVIFYDINKMLIEEFELTGVQKHNEKFHEAVVQVILNNWDVIKLTLED